MQFELLRLIVDQLDAAGIPHMVAGSFASTYHGEPRMTRGIDLVIDPDANSLAQFADGLDRERFYMPDWSDEFARRGMTNVIDTISGWKVDLIFRKDRPFSESEFGRRTRIELGGAAVHMATVEDTVLAKLEWAHQSGSERQLEDVRAMLAVQDTDAVYLDKWAAELGVSELLAAVRRSVRPREE